MKKTNHFKKLFLVLLILLSCQVYAQLSKTHYIPPMTDSGSSDVGDQHMYLSTPSEKNVTYWVYSGDESLLLFTNEGTSNELSKTSPVAQKLGDGNLSGLLFVESSTTSRVMTGKGYVVKATAPIYVGVRFNSQNNNQAGALVSKGDNALGEDFRVGAWDANNKGYMNFFSVMATENNTTVQFPGLLGHIDNNFSNRNYEGKDPEQIIENRSVDLQKGQSVIIALRRNSALIGQQITSTKSIVVSCGSLVGSFNGGSQSNGQDYGVDQIVGAKNVGDEYIFVRGNGQEGYEKVILIAANGDQNTTVRLNGGPPLPISSFGGNGNRFWNIIGSDALFLNGVMHIKTSSPVFAYQGVGGSANIGNKGLFFVPPLSCKARGNVENIPFINKIGDKDFDGGTINIVTKDDATISITSSTGGDLTANLTPKVSVFGTDYAVYKLTDPAGPTGNILEGNISIFSNRELYCSYTNAVGVATSGSYYAGFPNSPRIVFDDPFPLLGTCFPNSTIVVDNGEIFDRFKWYLDDSSGSGFQEITVTDDTQPSYTPEAVGTYRVDGIIECSRDAGLPTIITSEDIIIEACPSDVDADGVPDTLDIDNDNDGILDSEEPGDTDKDGIIDALDLDSDNDGIYDIQEAGRLPDADFDGRTDNTAFGMNGYDDTAETAVDNGIPVNPITNTDTTTAFDFLNIDSDSDGCNDVTEAEFTDNNDNGLLGDTPTSADVDENGKVTGPGTLVGYTGANTDYITGANVSITEQPIGPDILSNEDTSLSIETNATTIQWQVSTDASVTWTDIADDTIYNGSTTNMLSLTSVPLDFDTYQYRAVLTITGNSCEITNSDEVVLTVLPATLIYTGFSPNNDGINETFPLTNLKKQYPDFKITIFNRWGRAVFEGNISTADWNGKMDNNGDDVPVGVYYYVIEFNKDGRVPERGEIFVSR